MIKVTFAPAAIADLSRITHRIVANNGDAVARSMLARMRTSISRLAQFSGVGRRRPQLGAGVLSWPITPPFTVLFSRNSTDISILRIVDGKRRITRTMVSGEVE